MKKFTIYLLELEDQKYYLTYTTIKLEEAFERHKSEFNTCVWTNRYRPIRVLNSFEGDRDQLKSYSKELFTEYGFNLRGTFIDDHGLKENLKSARKPNPKVLVSPKEVENDPILDILDDPLDIRVLKMGSGTKRFYVVNSMDPQDFYNKMSSGLLPDDILDVPIVLSGTVKTSKDLFNKLVMKYGLDSIGFWKS